MKRPIMTLALIAGALGGGMYLFNNMRSLRAQAYRATSSAAGSLGLELPAGVRDAMLAPSTPMPQFSVRNPYELPTVHAGGTAGYYAGGANQAPLPSWAVDTSDYHATLAMLTGQASRPAAPASTQWAPVVSSGATFGVRAPTL